MNEIINTQSAPKAVGPYSQAIKSEKLLHVSGQIPLDPVSGNIVEGGIKEQTHQVLRNLKAVIEAAGFGFEDVVKCSCFLTDLNLYADFNAVYAEFFQEILPARECVEVSRLPRDVLVEISAIACK
jgi:2-iminobutanoate/2-iminopropanoate deaminase